MITIEQVARAICKSNLNDPDSEPASPGKKEWEYYEKDAKAAIQALIDSGWPVDEDFAPDDDRMERKFKAMLSKMIKGD